ncbi:Non-centrosomal microtubule array protein [Dirofilaria immitis]
MLCSSWLGAALNNVRFRRRENINDKDELKFEMPSRCISTPQSLNRNIPSTYDSNQFTTVRSTSFIDDFDSALSSRSRTAVVGPNMAQQSREGSLYDYGITDEKGNVRAYYSSDITRAYTSPPTPISRYDCGDPPPYYSHRRNTQPEDGQSYPLCSTPLSRSPRCEFSQSFSTADSSMLSRNTTNRPRELRIAPTSSSLMLRTTDNTANNTPSKHTNNIYPTSFRVHGTSGNTTTANNIGVGASIAIDEMVPMNNSTSNSRKMMVAPQPQNSHHRERIDSNCKSQQRRQSMSALVPAYHISAYGDNWRSRDHDSPSNDQQLIVDDRRAKNNNDVRVAVLEQRVRELEAAVIPGQVPSTSIPATSFIIPVIGSKNSSRILRSTSGQFLVSASTSSPVTQQLMAQEVVDKEIEVERLQSQLRKCYSRMELRQVQYDEEVSAFRQESEEAKLQLTKVKARLSELEKECIAYREKAMAVDANRNSAVASSLEKISAQEREITILKNDLERHMQLVKNLERMKKEYEFLELQNEALNAKLDSKEATIRDLEDSIHTMKMDACRKMESGSVTPKADNFSFFDGGGEHMKFLHNSKESIKAKGDRLSLSSSSVAAVEESIGSSKKVAKSSSPLQLCDSEIDRKVQLSSSTSKLIRMQLNITLECRLLAKCLKDIAAKAISGDAPSVNRLLGCRSDSMSESEPEPVLNDGSAMSWHCAERHIKKITEDLERIEKDLNSLRESFVEYYQKKIADELREDESCRIQ